MGRTRRKIYGPTMCGSGAISTCSISAAAAGRSKKASIWCQGTLKTKIPPPIARFPRKQPLAPLQPRWIRWWRSSAGYRSYEGWRQPHSPIDEHAELHRWDRDGPWRLVFVLPQETSPDSARDLLMRHSHVHQDVQTARHDSESYSVALVVDQRAYDKHRGLRPVNSR